MDVFAILIAVSLPWSTSLVAIFSAALLVSMGPFLDVRAFLQSLKRPVCALPIALFALALAGTLWSDAPWGARLYAVVPTAKLLMLPLLLYHFERSERGMWVLTAFLISCGLLMAMSWIVALRSEPLAQGRRDAERGIFVKNHIDQSQEFALCAVALAYPIVTFLRGNRILPAVLLIAVSLSFVVNMAFVTVSRTALVTMPIMLAVFALLHLKWRSILIIACAAAVLGGLAWTVSPLLRARTATFVSEYQLYKEEDRVTSIGSRLEYWKKSLRFIAEAPIIGHGTGSTRGLFERAATGPEIQPPAEKLSEIRITRHCTSAVQWGVLGVVALYAMWLLHLLLFRGEGLAAWIGLMVVVQNIFTSLFNSHLFDFHEGWMYVLGVGVAGGMVLGKVSHAAATGARNSAEP